MAKCTMTVTVVGGDILDSFVDAARKTVNTVNTVNTGRLGNFNTFNYILELEEEEVIAKRRELMSRLEQTDNRIVPMYVHGDWMRIFVFNRFAFKTHT